jgi:hypothetical protein
MTKFILLAAVAMLSFTSVSAEARDRWRQHRFQNWDDQPAYVYEDDEDFVSYDEPDDFSDEDVIIPLSRPHRAQRMRDAEKRIDAELWWLDDNARGKLEQRQRARKPLVKKNIVRVETAAKPKVKVAAPAKPKLVTAKNVQTASLSKPDAIAKPESKPVSTKTIGCTAGAAVVTGYGFGDVKPRACTGTTYAYTAARGGKNYEIKLTAATGEIVDVKKLNQP